MTGTRRLRQPNDEVSLMQKSREKTGEHVTFLFRLLELLIQKTPAGGVTTSEIQALYENAKKGNLASEKIIQRAIHRLNYIFDPDSAAEDPMFRTPRKQLPVRSSRGKDGVRRYTFHRQLASETVPAQERTTKVMLQLYPQQRQMQADDFEQLLVMLAADRNKKDDSVAQLRANIERYVYVSGFTPAESRKNLQKMLLIFQALCRKKKIRFRYTSASTGEKTGSREVAAYGLVSRHGVWYLVGLCHEVNAVRIFRVDHIDAPVLLESSTYDIPAGYSLADKFGSLWGIWTESEKPPATEKVKLHVAAPVASHFDTIRYHASQSVHKNSDGSLEVEFTAGGVREMLPWLMGWGEHVKVLQPDWLREELIIKAKRMLTQYE